MPKRKRLLTTTVAKKVLSALTGLLLCGYLVAHLAGNLLLYVGRGELFNAYANKLNGIPFLLLIELLLLALILAHAYLGVRVWRENKKARPTEYHQKRWARGGKLSEGPRPAGTRSRKSLGSTTMAISGLITLAFIFLHVWHFKFGWHYPLESERSGEAGIAAVRAERDSKSAAAEDARRGLASTALAEGGPHSRDLARLVIEEFRKPWIVLAYVVCLILLGLHLNHGFSSAFQSMGVSGYGKTWLVVGRVYTFLIIGGFLSIPLWIFLFRKAPAPQTAKAPASALARTERGR